MPYQGRGRAPCARPARMCATAGRPLYARSPCGHFPPRHHPFGVDLDAPTHRAPKTAVAPVRQPGSNVSTRWSIGGGQAGLAVGYHLARRGMPFVILDASERDRRRVAPAAGTRCACSPRPGTTACRACRFPAPPHAFPTKDEMADYLEAYAARFELPVRIGVRVDGCPARRWLHRARSGAATFEADHVVVAMASYQRPAYPAFAARARSAASCSSTPPTTATPASCGTATVLLVGAGNSGAEIAIELARDHRVCLSGRHVGHAPVPASTASPGACLVPIVLRGLFHRVLTVRTPHRRAKPGPRSLAHGRPAHPHQAARPGRGRRERVPRITGVRDGRPLLDDGRVLDVANVRLVHRLRARPLLDRPARLRRRDGRPAPRPRHRRRQPGLYFVGPALPLRAVVGDDPRRRP